MKNSMKFWLVMTLMSVGHSAFALKGDTEQPIHIDSGSQSLKNNVVTFSDNVLIRQGTIKVTANKVNIIRQEGKKEIVEAFGSPVTFQQVLDNGKTIKGQGNKVNYDLGSEFLVLSGHAQLHQEDSFIQAEKITYDVRKQQLKASRGGESRVKTRLIPAQLQGSQKSR